MDVYEYDEEDGGRSPLRVIAAIVLIGAVLAAGWFVVRPRLTGDDDDTATPAAAATTSEASTSEPAGDDGPGPTGDTTDSSAPDADSTVALDVSTTAASPSGADDSTTTAPTSEPPAETTTTAPTSPSATVATSTSEPSTASTEAAPVTSAPERTTTTTALDGETPVPGTYATLDDGSPLPVVAIFDVGRVTLTGAVPDQAAAERLELLALANARGGAEANTLVNNLTINPAVPRGVGVRVIEVTSTRFPEGSAEVLPPHALELDRVFDVMQALPNVSVLVIGHADQQGDDLANFALSEDRARAVVTYLAGRGIVPSRLSSRAVGEADLLSIDDDEASLALNRRTEFIFYGLLNP